MIISVHDKGLEKSKTEKLIESGWEEWAASRRKVREGLSAKLIPTWLEPGPVKIWESVFQAERRLGHL